MAFRNLAKQPKLEFIIFFAFLFVVFFSLKVSSIAASEKYRRIVLSKTTYQFSPDIVRGSIRDKYGRLLVFTKKTLSVYVYPESLENKIETAVLMENKGIIDKNSFLSAINSSSGFTWLIRDAESEIIDSVRNLSIRGIGIYYDHMRIYAREACNRNIIGKVNRENRGVSGIEYVFDRYLKGENYTTDMARNHRGDLYPINSEISEHIFIGDDIYLTIDMDLQEIIQDILDSSVQMYNAKGGVVIVMDPRSGDILAMNISYRDTKNMAIEWTYEPGSTFKIITAIAAISEQSVELDDTVETGEGQIEIADYVINDAESHPALDFKDALIHSSNVGFVRIALKTGSEIINKYTILFGFGEKTGINLPGEIPGYIPRLSKWNEITTATASFGQGISVNPLQLCQAYGVVANGGYLIRPRIVDRIISIDGRINVKPVDTLRRVTSKIVSRIFTDLLVKVVDEGTGRNAAISGIEIAGKTGTAEIPSPDGKYYEDKFIASFIGYFPASDPEYVICVVINEPVGNYYGGQVSAPVFREIVSEILELKKFRRTFNYF